MSKLNEHFERVLSPHLNGSNKVVLALSGGVDSRVLLSLLAQYKHRYPDVNCVAIHVHHGLSPHADDWAKQCLFWCQEEGIECHVERVSIERQSRTSLEKQARDARYQALGKHMSVNDVLITGQHSDDQVETFLLALKRGSGPKGLSSMAQSMTFSRGVILRPLLSIRRQDVEHYAHSQNLQWVEDESNQDTKFDRNFLRHEVIPKLTERWSGFSSSVQRSAELCAEQELLIDELLSPAFQNAVNEYGALSIGKLEEQSELARYRLLRMWFSKAEAEMPSRAQLKELWQGVALARADANPILVINDKTVRRYSHHLYLLPQLEDVSGWRGQITLGKSISLPDGLGTLTLRQSVGRDDALSDCLHLSLEPGTESLVVSFEPQGLTVEPENRKGSRKLKKVMQEYGIPPWQRRRMPILLSREHVVAVAGMFVSKHNTGQKIELIWRK